MERHQPQTGAAGPRPGIRRRASAWADPPVAAPPVPGIAGAARQPPDMSLVLSRAARWGRDARVVATVLGILAGLGLVGATLSFTVDLFVAPWRIFTLDVEESLHLLASLVGLAGAFQLSRGARRGRPVVLAGLALNVAATLYFSGRTMGSPDTLLPMLTWLALAVWTVACRRRQPPGPDAQGGWTPAPWQGVDRYPWPPPPPP